VIEHPDYGERYSVEGVKAEPEVWKKYVEKHSPCKLFGAVGYYNC
jgi:hypothetical protein